MSPFVRHLNSLLSLVRESWNQRRKVAKRRPSLHHFRPMLESLEGRLVPSVTPTAAQYQTQLVSNSNAGASSADIQYVSAGSYQTVSSLTVNVGANDESTFDMSFSAYVRSNSTNDFVKVRYLIDGQIDPNDVIDNANSGYADLSQSLTQNNYGNWASLSLTHQLTLSPGTHTISVQVEDFANSGIGPGDDLVVWAPVLDVTKDENVLTGPQPSPTPTQLVDQGFELPGVGSGPGAYAYDPSGSPWTFQGNAGVTGNGSGFTSGNANAPQGSQVAFLQGAGSVSQTFDISGGTYVLSFDAAQRGNYNHGGQEIEVLVDGSVVGTITPQGASYSRYNTSSFTISDGSHTIEFLGLNPNGGDNTAFIDDLAINMQ